MLACAARHQIDTAAPYDVDARRRQNEACAVVSCQLTAGQSIRITKFVAYHTSRYSPQAWPTAEVVDDAAELAMRCNRSLDRVEHEGFDALVAAQADWLDEFWERSDVELCAAGRRRPRTRPLSDRPLRARADQQAMRWNLFQLAQASAQTGEQGIAAKGVTGGGYEGHYFWDTEMYVAPFLAYTAPEAARQLLRFRWQMLPVGPPAGPGPQPGRRAVPVAHDQRRGGVGLLRGRHRPVPHQRRDRLRPPALRRRQRRHRLPRHRRRRDPRWRRRGCGTTSASTRRGGRNGNGRGRSEPTFHIHGVTGPDEYTAVVNDNLYTNVMARFNMR